MESVDAKLDAILGAFKDQRRHDDRIFDEHDRRLSDLERRVGPEGGNGSI
jgi:hypothetical protein